MKYPCRRLGQRTRHKLRGWELTCPKLSPAGRLQLPAGGRDACNRQGLVFNIATLCMSLTVDLIRLQLQETHPCFSHPQPLLKDAKIELQGVTFHGLEPLCCCEAPIFHWGESKHYHGCRLLFSDIPGKSLFHGLEKSTCLFNVCRDNKRGELRKTEAAEPLGTTSYQSLDLKRAQFNCWAKAQPRQLGLR